jgi:hypothetical protein
MKIVLTIRPSVVSALATRPDGEALLKRWSTTWAGGLGIAKGSRFNLKLYQKMFYTSRQISINL